MKSEKKCSVTEKAEGGDWLRTCLTSFDAATGIPVHFAQPSEPPLPQGRPTFCHLLQSEDPAVVASCTRFHAECCDEARGANYAIRRECPCGITLLWAPVARQEAFYGLLETEPLVVVPESGRVNPIAPKCRAGGRRTRVLLENAFRRILTARQYHVNGVLLVLQLLADHIARGFKEHELFATPASAPLALAHRAEQYMRLHFNEPLSTCDLAKELHVSEQHLCRAFRQETGKTILQFLSDLRVERVCDLLLAQPELTVAETALASGFQSIPRFYSVFHMLTGTNPTHWHEENKSR